MTLQEMHEFCLQYRDMVRAGQKPSEYSDKLFLGYSAQTYATGVALQDYTPEQQGKGE